MNVCLGPLSPITVICIVPTHLTDQGGVEVGRAGWKGEGLGNCHVIRVMYGPLLGVIAPFPANSQYVQGSRFPAKSRFWIYLREGVESQTVRVRSALIRRVFDYDSSLGQNTCVTIIWRGRKP